MFTFFYSLLDVPFVSADYNQALPVVSFSVLYAIPTCTGSLDKHFHSQI